MDNDKIDQHSDEIEVESEEKERGKKIEIDEDRLPSRAMAIHEHIRQDGEKEHICEICKYKETKTIPAAGDSGSNTNNTNNTIRATAGSASAPQTGDNNQMLLCLSLLFASGFGVTGATLYGRRKKHSRQR